MAVEGVDVLLGSHGTGGNDVDVRVGVEGLDEFCDAFGSVSEIVVGDLYIVGRREVEEVVAVDRQAFVGKEKDSDVGPRRELRCVEPEPFGILARYEILHAVDLWQSRRLYGLDSTGIGGYEYLQARSFHIISYRESMASTSLHTSSYDQSGRLANIRYVTSLSGKYTSTAL